LLKRPKGRRYARVLLLAAWQALKPGGKLLLAGPSRQGAKSVIKDAERLFGNAAVLGYRNHQRIGSCIRGDSLPNPLPKPFQQRGIAPGSTHIIETKYQQGSLTLETHPGIFSWDAIDEGTALLLENLTITDGDRIWDVGCGYGVIGLSAALGGASRILMSDTNLLSVLYANKNANRNQLSGIAKTFPAVGLSQKQIIPPYDLIVSNPAFHRVHKVDVSMADSLISTSNNFLTPKGRLVIVANQFLKYDKYMQKYFKFVSRIAETSKYNVIEAHN